MSTDKLNEYALEVMGKLENVKKFMSDEDLRAIGLKKEDLDNPSSLIFEQIMALLRKYFGDRPECAEVLLFQKVMPRDVISDFSRDLVPVPLIYEVTAHLMKYGLIDHVVTTNFDELLDRAMTKEMGKKGYVRVHHLSKYQSVLSDRVYENSPLLIKVHGTISYSLTMRQLVDDVIRLERHKMKLLQEVLSGAVVVLIGHSLYNPNLQELFYRLNTKGMLRDVFVVKRHPTSRAGFVESLTRDKPDNLILMDCESFAIKLAKKIEEIEIEIEIDTSSNSKAGAIKAGAIKFFPNFTGHFIKYLFFNRLKLYPCPATSYLIEFIILLMKAKGLMSEYGASFIITGEVIGQRPMSQRADAIKNVTKLAGDEEGGIILRPMSAKL